MGDRSLAVALRRLLLLPKMATRIAEDAYFAPLLVRLRGVEMGEGCVFAGSPSIRIAPGARIKLGARVTLSSRPDANPLGLPHPTILAAVGPSATIDIGDDVGISGASIVARESIVIGRSAMIGAGACIWDTDFHPLDAAERRVHPTDGAKSAPVVIEEEAFLGARAIVLKGVRIGRGAVVGAGAVVSRDVAPYNVVAGNPARVVKILNPDA